MEKKPAKILLVEDDANLGTVVQDYLQILNYEVTLAKNGKEGLEAFQNTNPDLCILDVMMPIMDGYTLAENIRKINDDVPIVFLTARVMKEDRIQGFKKGGDDYITKPFSSEELGLRIAAILKRINKADSQPKEVSVFMIGNYKFDYKNLSLKFGNDTQTLTRKEADLLHFFIQNINTSVTREEALLKVWGTNDYFLGRSMDVFISRLRKYLKKDERIAIQNLHGSGFRFQVEV